MAQGYIKISSDLLDKGTPAFHEVLQSFTGRGKIKNTILNPRTMVYTITLDHPDFIQDGDNLPYDLIIAQRRDMHGNTMYVLGTLKVYTGDRWSIHKDYLAETQGTVHVKPC